MCGTTLEEELEAENVGLATKRLMGKTEPPLDVGLMAGPAEPPTRLTMSLEVSTGAW